MKKLSSAEKQFRMEEHIKQNCCSWCNDNHCDECIGGDKYYNTICDIMPLTYNLSVILEHVCELTKKERLDTYRIQNLLLECSRLVSDSRALITKTGISFY